LDSIITTRKILRLQAFCPANGIPPPCPVPGRAISTDVKKPRTSYEVRGFLRAPMTPAEMA
jgi:hypothetical protein